MAKSDILNKILGAGLTLASVGFFSVSYGMAGHAEAMVPGILFGAGGFWLMARRERRAGPDLEAQKRLDQLASGLAATQAELAGLHEQLDRVAEERDFMRQLATPPGRATGLPAGAVAPASTAAADQPEPTATS